MFIRYSYHIPSIIYNKKAAKLATPMLPTHIKDPIAPYATGPTVKAPAALELVAAAVPEVPLVDAVAVADAGRLERAASAA